VQRGSSSARNQEILAVALRHHQGGQLAEAEALYKRILQSEPQHADALHFLGVLAHQLGRNGQAIELISRAIAQNRRIAAFHNNLGNALRALGKLAEAVQSYRRALYLKPDYVEALYNLGVALQAQEDWSEATASYKRALKLNPQHVDAYNNLGNVLQAQGRLEEAVAAYRSALSCSPTHIEAHVNLGNVLKAQGQWDRALSAYSRALELDPGYAQAHNNLGMVLLQQGRLQEALGAYSRALASKPEYAEAHNNMAHVLQEQGRAAEAVAAFGRALALKPDYAQARLGQAIAAIPVFAADAAESGAVGAQFSHSLAALTQWDEEHPGALGRAVGTSQPFYLAYRPVDVTELLGRYGELVCGAAAAAAGRTVAVEVGSGGVGDALGVGEVRGAPAAVVAVGDRIRLGIVSAQVRRQHPVWEVLLRGVIAHLDRGQFELFLYHTDSAADEETDWARNQVDRFVQGPRSTQSWLEEIRRDRPDVLFYPEVGMDPATCALAALRLAPLQVAAWGHPVTTGLPTMDLFVSGELLEGEGAQHHYREHLLRLPGTGVCTELPPIQAQHWNDGGRSAEAVRFALCQQPIKFDPADDVLLARIARSVGDCEFWLASPNKLRWTGERLRERLGDAFLAQGLDPRLYLRLLPWMPRPQFAGFLDSMDVYLDCPAFSGYTTAWQAVHRGLPIVTVEGEFMRQRLAAGLLRQIGVTDGIAASRDEYVEIAVRFAREHRASRLQRRQTIQAAAKQADGNRAAVDAFGLAVAAAFRRSQLG
jgi:protein O-GlcNAc transferase